MKDEHPKNVISIPPSTDGFFFCLWDAVGGDAEWYRRVRAGHAPCPIADTCPIRASHLELIEQRRASSVWASLSKRERRRVQASAQRLLFEFEQQLGANVVGPVVREWLESQRGTLIGVRMRHLFDSRYIEESNG